MKRFTFGIQFQPGSNNELLVGRCLKILHGFQCRHSINSVGVTFPKFCDKTISDIIACVSVDRLCLQQLMSQPYFLEMQRLQKFFFHEITIVPDNVKEVRYGKELKSDKYCEGGRQRRIRRGQRIAEKKGYKYLPRQNPSSRVRNIQLFHNIPMTSSEDPTQVFYFRLQKHAAKNICCDGYTSYGLANQECVCGTVPDLTFTKK